MTKESKRPEARYAVWMGTNWKFKRLWEEAFRLTDQMAVKPDEYTMDSTVCVEYLGERVAAYLVRVTELDN